MLYSRRLTVFSNNIFGLCACVSLVRHILNNYGRWRINGRVIFRCYRDVTRVFVLPVSSPKEHNWHDENVFKNVITALRVLSIYRNTFQPWDQQFCNITTNVACLISCQTQSIEIHEWNRLALCWWLKVDRWRGNAISKHIAYTYMRYMM